MPDTTITALPDAASPLTGTERVPMDQSGATITAGGFTPGRSYRIVSAGTTVFTEIGAAANTVGTVFVATGSGTGSGTAAEITTVDAAASAIAALATKSTVGLGNVSNLAPADMPISTATLAALNTKAGSAFVYQQSTPAATWTINHNLGYRPSVELLDSGSQEIEGDVSHPTVNQAVVTLSPASAGLARLA